MSNVSRPRWIKHRQMDKSQGYGALEDLVWKGFLLGGVRFKDHLLTFKTINEKEFSMIRTLAGSLSMKENDRFTNYFLVFSLFAVDGEPVLHRRFNLIPDLVRFFDDAPWELTVAITNHLKKMRDTSFESVQFLEGFTYTNRSRSAWRHIKPHLPNEETLTGIPGTSNMGLNVHQENWIYLNSILDEEELYEHDFNMSMLIASASNPKGAKQIRNQHDGQLKNVEDRRKHLAEHGRAEARKNADGWAAPTETTEELLAELNRQMEGVKDKHDIYIERHLSKMREAAEQRAKEAEERIRRIREGTENATIVSSQRPVTEEDISRMRSNKGVDTVDSEEKAKEEDKYSFHRKIGARVLTGRR